MSTGFLKRVFVNFSLKYLNFSLKNLEKEQRAIINCKKGDKEFEEFYEIYLTNDLNIKKESTIILIYVKNLASQKN